MYSTYLSWYHSARRNEFDCGTGNTWEKPIIEEESMQKHFTTSIP